MDSVGFYSKPAQVQDFSYYSSRENSVPDEFVVENCCYLIGQCTSVRSRTTIDIEGIVA